ncbi:Protein CBR-SOD-4 [Caenorhabditis briggsae]|uniref:Superoxide dismutase [Cu-Zn] n=1 Tax=Caenorhabditis briggsae TaxID=6238 RepID=A8XAB4_CAEBR|nr:Protein CBR-SOD-4 [Caenorhabditis briggsae]CAP29582.2 Protein CBR-SOD-4 [Caenorhabditis briggsae]
MKNRVILVLALLACTEAASEVIRARAYIFKAVEGQIPTELIGTIDFDQSGSFLKLNGSVSGLAAGKHGFHIHEKGDTGNGCLSAGSHYNPHKLSHGAPDDSNRHIGDLGNIESPVSKYLILMIQASGDTAISVSDSLASLSGQYSIIGRSVVIHEKTDDLGRGNSDQSKTTGNAGARLACGTIGTFPFPT